MQALHFTIISESSQYQSNSFVSKRTQFVSVLGSFYTYLLSTGHIILIYALCEKKSFKKIIKYHFRAHIIESICRTLKIIAVQLFKVWIST